MYPKKWHLCLVLNEFIAMAAMAMPIILTRILLYARSMISMFFHSPLDHQLALSGGSFAVGFAHITGYTFLYSLARGMEPISSQAFGAGKHTRLSLCLQKTILLLLITCIPISLLRRFHRLFRRFFGFTNVSSSSDRNAHSPIQFAIPNVPGTRSYRDLVRAIWIVNRTPSSELCASLSFVSNFPIDYILITKLQLGIKGVAISTVLTDFCFLAFLIIYILISGVYKKIWVGGIWREGFKGWNSLLNHAVQSCLSFYLVEEGRFQMMNFLCGSLNNPGACVSSMRILIEFTKLIYVFSSSLSSIALIRVGTNLGAGRLVEAKVAAINVALFCTIVLGLPVQFFSATFSNLWPVMFTRDEEIIALTSSVMPIVGLYLLGNCLLTTGCGVLRGTAQPESGAILGCVCVYIVGMLVAVVVGVYMGLGFRGLWLAMPVAQMFEFLTLSVVLVKVDWKAAEKRAIELSLTDDGGGGVGGFKDEAPMSLIEA
ncbi:hypothetical protein LXL04_021909 [Taraxacum kok-saghyz]